MTPPSVTPSSISTRGARAFAPHRSSTDHQKDLGLERLSVPADTYRDLVRIYLSEDVFNRDVMTHKELVACCNDMDRCVSDIRQVLLCTPVPLREALRLISLLSAGRIREGDVFASKWGTDLVGPDSGGGLRNKKSDFSDMERNFLALTEEESRLASAAVNARRYQSSNLGQAENEYKSHLERASLEILGLGLNRSVWSGFFDCAKSLSQQYTENVTSGEAYGRRGAGDDRGPRRIENDLALSPTDFCDAVRSAQSTADRFIEIRNKVVEGNVRLAVSEAKKFLNCGLEFIDVIQASNSGLIKGVERFDPSKGFRFSNYAKWWIRESIFEALNTEKNAVRVPVDSLNLLLHVLKEKGILEAKLERRPTDHEIAESLGMNVQTVRILLSAPRKLLSLDAPIGPDGLDSESFGSSIKDPDTRDPIEDVTALQRIHKLNQALDCLDPLSRAVITKRFDLGESSGRVMRSWEVANSLNISTTRAEQLELRALNLLGQQSAGLHGLL